MSSLQGIVRPPIGCSNPNSSSAMFSNSWNEGWFKNDIGIKKRLLSLSPTYTAMWPFGTSIDVEATCFPNEFGRRRMCLACIILSKRIAMSIYLYCGWRWWISQQKREKTVGIWYQWMWGLVLASMIFVSIYIDECCVWKSLKCGVNGVEAIGLGPVRDKAFEGSHELVF